MKVQKSLIVLIPAILLVLGGCQKTKEILGMNKNPPNEFTVMQRAPLEVPPEYTLRPPQPGSKRPQELSAKPAHVKAKEIVVRNRRSSLQKSSRSRGEKAFLAKTGAHKADKNIRIKVDSESYVEKNKHDDKNWFAKKLPFYKAPQNKNLINPKEEQERLKEQERQLVQKREKNLS